MDILERLNALRGTAHDVGVEAIAEIERLRNELAQEKEEHDRCTTFHAIAVKERNYERVLALKRDADIENLRGALKEIRIRLHAAGRRPEECYEMSIIDDALRGRQ